MNTVPVGIITPGVTNDRGADFPDWTDVTTTAEAWSSMQPLSSTEVLELGRQASVTMLRGYGPYDSVITPRCRCTYNGSTYEGVMVNHGPSLTGNLAHTEATFERADG